MEATVSTTLFSGSASIIRGLYSLYSPDNPHHVKNITRTTYAVAALSLIYYTLSRLFSFDTEMLLDVRGVPFHLSWFTLAMIALFWVDGVHYIQKYEWRANQFQISIAGVVVVFGVVGSVLFHEYCHALVAGVYGHPITEAGMSWWGAYVGWDDSVALAPIEGSLIALAGPLANFALAAVFAFFVWLLPERLTENSIQYMAYTNIRLGKFNLFPLFLLDGGKVADGFLQLIIGTGNETLHVIILTVMFLVAVRWYNREGMKGRRLEDHLANM